MNEKEIKRRHAHFINRFNIALQAEKFLTKNEGVMGYLFVAANYFDSNFGYKNIPDSMKNFNLFSVGSNKTSKIAKTTKRNSNDGTMDGFLVAGEDKIDTTYNVVDDDSGLPAFASMKEVDFGKLSYDKSAKNLMRIGQMTLKEYENFKNAKNKFEILSNKIKKSIIPQSHSSSCVDKSSAEFDLKRYEINEKPSASIKSVNIDNKAEKLDDIGEIKKAKESLIILEPKVGNYGVDDDIGEIKKAKEPLIILEPKVGNYGVDDEINDIKYDNITDSVTIEEGTDGISDYLDNLSINNKNTADLDEDELFNINADKSKVSFDKKTKELKISNKFEFGW